MATMEIDVQLAVGDVVNHKDTPLVKGKVIKRAVRKIKVFAFTETETFAVEYLVQWEDGEDPQWFTYGSLVKS